MVGTNLFGCVCVRLTVIWKGDAEIQTMAAFKKGRKQEDAGSAQYGTEIQCKTQRESRQHRAMYVCLCA